MAISDVHSYFETITRIYSPSGEEDELIRYLEAEFNRQEVPVIYSGAGGLIARIPSTSEEYPALFFVAHLDTASNGTKPEVILEEKTYKASAGFLGADDKAGVAALLAVISTLKETRMPHGTIEFIFTTKEESGLQGVKMLELSCLSARYGFCLDAPGEVGSYQRISDTQAKMDFRVLQRFSTSDVSGINVARAILHHIKQLRLPPKFNLEMTRFEGERSKEGDEAVQVELNLSGYFLLEELLLEVENVKLAFTQAEQKYGVKVGSDVHIIYPGFEIKEAHPSVTLAKRALKQQALDSKEVRFIGGSDANILNDRGFETLLLSAGYEKAHSENEQITQDSLLVLTQVILDILAQSRGMEVVTAFPKTSE
ncbi:M20/M25/M40 family metallo-hydrolase [Listeria kieliensis]|uniref:Peptidase M20 n=1 Tax=Listeria kieliensis TaxID=1621700 RepID=A0A3D8TV69_9LIST|nr:M20/M25/M40 family metallo-hydrolase [Listeria kieliensis]RDX02883.1 hypothetical protein UR08_05120 [Listeria kieliensis]